MSTSLRPLRSAYYDRAIEVRPPAEANNFPVASVHTKSDAHPASYPMGIGDPLLWGKARPGRDADHSPTTSAVFKNE